MFQLYNSSMGHQILKIFLYSIETFSNFLTKEKNNSYYNVVFNLQSWNRIYISVHTSIQACITTQNANDQDVL